MIRDFNPCGISYRDGDAPTYDHYRRTLKQVDPTAIYFYVETAVLY